MGVNVRGDVMRLGNMQVWPTCACLQPLRRERESEGVCVCVREREREREVCVCVRERKPILTI
jgi:hypothetical protein